MCFSATASFAAAGVMAGIGAVSVIHNRSRSHRMLAAIPLLFAIQQASEGIVWETINRPAHTQAFAVAVTAFLGFALVVWPTWLPLSLLRMETDVKRRRLIRTLVWLGVVVSAFGASVLIFWSPVAQIDEHSIRYDYPHIGTRAVQVGYFLLYLVPAVVPTFLSSMSMARWIGGVLLVSLITTIAIKLDTLTSVWCFFATTLSCLIVLSTYRRQRVPSAAFQAA
jgi:hypothetical protein